MASYAAPKKSPNVFLSVRYRVTRASDWLAWLKPGSEERGYPAAVALIL